MSEISEKMRIYVDSQIGKDVKTVLAYTVRKTKTTKDDEIIDNVDDIKDLVSQAIDDIADVKPSDEEAKEAVIRLLKGVASLTSTKIDDMVVSIIDKVI